MKLYVCGCSYLSCDDNHPGTHFSEIISDRIDYDLVSLARQGTSNSVVRLQVERAVQESADLVIINGVHSNRFEVPLHRVFSTQPQKDYDPARGLDNIDYRYYPNRSRHNLDNNRRASMFSDHYTKFYSTDFDPEFTLAWKHYMSSIYCQSWQKQQDQWIVESSLCRLMTSGTAFVYFPMDQPVPSWLPSDNVYDRPNKTLLDYSDKNVDTAYHTTPANQLDFVDHFLPWLQRYLLVDQ